MIDTTVGPQAWVAVLQPPRPNREPSPPSRPCLRSHFMSCLLVVLVPVHVEVREHIRAGIPRAYEPGSLSTDDSVFIEPATEAVIEEQALSEYAAALTAAWTAAMPARPEAEKTSFGWGR